MVLPLFLERSRLGGNDAGTGVEVDHSTIKRWMLRSAPALVKRLRSHLHPTHDSWSVDENDIEIRGVEVSVESGGFRRPYAGLPAECEAGRSGSSALPA